VPPEAEPTRASAPVPPGWSHNPSAWRTRVPVIVLALAGASVAGYLALFQLGWLRHVWEPWFGEGSRIILTSSVSRMLPIPDAALGFAGYACDAIAGMLGGSTRWRTAPWLVLVFGAIVGLLGAAGIVLVILQATVFHAWCTLCLTSAAISLTMVALALDEVLASLGHLTRVRAHGGSLWLALTGHAS